MGKTAYINVGHSPDGACSACMAAIFDTREAAEAGHDSIVALNPGWLVETVPIEMMHPLASVHERWPVQPWVQRRKVKLEGERDE